MSNLMGFIVEIRTKYDNPVVYKYGKDYTTLKADESFIGYFGQANRLRPDGPYNMAIIDKIKIIDKEKKLFEYEKCAVFDLDEVKIELWALRGPESNNTCLPEKYKKYETWNAVNSR